MTDNESNTDVPVDEGDETDIEGDIAALKLELATRKSQLRRSTLQKVCNNSQGAP